MGRGGVADGVVVVGVYGVGGKAMADNWLVCFILYRNYFKRLLQNKTAAIPWSSLIGDEQLDRPNSRTSGCE